MKLITKQELKRYLADEKPNNESRLGGYALVDVLSRESYLDQHIPYSMNVPKGNEDEFQMKFDKKKEIIVYSASPECRKSEDVARELEERGYTAVRRYAGGMKEWRQGTDVVPLEGKVAFF